MFAKYFEKSNVQLYNKNNVNYFGLFNFYFIFHYIHKSRSNNKKQSVKEVENYIVAIAISCLFTR